MRWDGSRRNGNERDGTRSEEVEWDGVKRNGEGIGWDEVECVE